MAITLVQLHTFWRLSELGNFTRTAEELSIVCPQAAVPAEVHCQRDWRCFRVAGTLPFAAVDILASLVGPLARASISVFVVSTYDTDYLLVNANDSDRARDVLKAGGADFADD